MKPTFYCHPAMVFITPCISHCIIQCSDEKCGAVHGWQIEIGWLFWSFCIEHHYGTPL